MTEQGVEIVLQRTRERFNQSIKVECIRPGTPLSLEDARRELPLKAKGEAPGGRPNRTVRPR